MAVTIKNRKKTFFLLLAIAVFAFRSVSTFAGSVTIISGIPEIDANTTNVNKYSSYWQYWSQGASIYSGMRLYGCRVVAYSKLLAEIGMNPGNPDAFVSGK